MKKVFTWGFIFLIVIVLLGLNIGAKNFNQDMGQPAAVVFAWEEIQDPETGSLKYKGIVLGHEFYILQSNIDEFKKRFQKSYQYWAAKLN